MKIQPCKYCGKKWNCAECFIAVLKEPPEALPNNNGSNLVKPADALPESNKELDTQIQKAISADWQIDGKNPNVKVLITQQTRQARIDELLSYPLNWADNRKDEVWRKMILSRLAELNREDAQ